MVKANMRELFHAGILDCVIRPKNVIHYSLNERECIAPELCACTVLLKIQIRNTFRYKNTRVIAIQIFLYSYNQ